MKYMLLTIITTSGWILGISAAIKCRSSCLEKSPVYKIWGKKTHEHFYVIFYAILLLQHPFTTWCSIDRFIFPLQAANVQILPILYFIQCEHSHPLIIEVEFDKMTNNIINEEKNGVYFSSMYRKFSYCNVSTFCKRPENKNCIQILP